MKGLLLIDKPAGWTSLSTETNLRFFSSRGESNESLLPAALFPEAQQ